ncbi:MAG: ABC transporter substrate-binding protein [Betaproteobacteria bacterium]|nr:ABC transporter substrate-binding protein [Betaproteobacteria bacterium]
MVSLQVATANYDRIMALALGDVRAEGIELTVKRMPTPEVLARADKREFDVTEFSISKYIEQRERGDDRYQAIPVFLSRFFRHWSMYVSTRSGIETPADLRGKRAGVINYRYTSSVWTRGILQHEYGILPKDMRWIQVEDIPPPDDPEVQLETRVGADLGKMLIDGEIDFLVAPYAPAAMYRKNPPVRRLLPNAGQLERDYYRRTGIFPQMHTLVVKSAVLDKNPWVAESLYKAFGESKQWALTHLKALRTSLPWLYEQIEEVDAIMGQDYWPYGVEANRSGVELIVNYMVEQKIIGSRIGVDRLFLTLN